VNASFGNSEASDTTRLLEQAKAGDPDAFCELCQAHEGRLFRQSLALCGNRSRAEELAEDTLVVAWESLHRYNGKCQFFTWLCAILFHRHRNALRRKDLLALPVPTNESEFTEDAARLVDGGPLPDEIAQHRERDALVKACIGALPKKHQDVIYLRFYVDDSLEGIAAALRCSVGTVKSRLFHALEKLRRMKILREETRPSKEHPELYEAMH
jgi:RNA polymerase sigma-70 factor, ECF subfamily